MEDMNTLEKGKEVSLKYLVLKEWFRFESGKEITISF